MFATDAPGGGCGSWFLVFLCCVGLILGFVLGIMLLDYADRDDAEAARIHAQVVLEAQRQEHREATLATLALALGAYIPAILATIAILAVAGVVCWWLWLERQPPPL